MMHKYRQLGVIADDNAGSSRPREPVRLTASVVAPSSRGGQQPCAHLPPSLALTWALGGSHSHQIRTVTGDSWSSFASARPRPKEPLFGRQHQSSFPRRANEDLLRIRPRPRPHAGLEGHSPSNSSPLAGSHRRRPCRFVPGPESLFSARGIGRRCLPGEKRPLTHPPRPRPSWPRGMHHAPIIPAVGRESPSTLRPTRPSPGSLPVRGVGRRRLVE